jgi:hypothetical protein
LGKSQYSKVTAAVDEELNFAGYDEEEEEEEDEDEDEDTSPLAASGRRRA